MSRARRDGGRAPWIVAALALCAAPGPTLLLAGLLAPALGLRWALGPMARDLARVMLLFGIAGGVPLMLDFLARGWGLLGLGPGGAVAMLHGPAQVGWVWAWQGAGLLLAEGLPLVLALLLGLQAARRRRELLARRSQLLSEWSLPE